MPYKRIVFNIKLFILFLQLMPAAYPQPPESEAKLLLYIFNNKQPKYLVWLAKKRRAIQRQQAPK